MLSVHLQTTRHTAKVITDSAVMNVHVHTYTWGTTTRVHLHLHVHVHRGHTYTHVGAHLHTYTWGTTTRVHMHPHRGHTHRGTPTHGEQLHVCTRTHTGGTPTCTQSCPALPTIVRTWWTVPDSLQHPGMTRTSFLVAQAHESMCLGCPTCPRHSRNILVAQTLLSGISL